MDTSTPLKKLCSKQLSSLLSSKYDNVNTLMDSKYENNGDFPTKQADSDGLFCDSKFTDANTSIEVFPVSPICCVKNASTNLVNLPNLDSSNLKWSSSLHTLHAEDEIFEEDTMDLIRSQYHCTADNNDYSTNFRLTEACDEIGNEQFDAVKNTSDVPCSPIFTAARGKRRRRDKEPPPDENNAKQIDSSDAGKDLSDISTVSVSEDIRCLNEHAFEFDDSYCNMFNVGTQLSKPSESMRLKTSLYSLNLRHENSKKFVYPLANVSIKKPETHLRVEQLTNYALCLEARDLRLGSSAHKPEAKTKANMFTENTLIVFNKLYGNTDEERDTVINGNRSIKISQHGRQIASTLTTNCKNFDEKLYSNVLRNFVKIIFACRNNDRDTIQKRFYKITDQFSNSRQFAVRLMRVLYSYYFFVTFIDLASYRTDDFYKRNVVQHLIRRVRDSFKFIISIDYVENTFSRIQNDVYLLEKLGIPVTTLYISRFNTLRCLCSRIDLKNESTKLHSKSTNVTRVLKNEKFQNYKENVTGDLIDSAPFNRFQKTNNNHSSIPEKSLKRFADKHCHVLDGQRDDKKRRIENSSAFVTTFVTVPELSLSLSSSSSSNKVNSDIADVVNTFRTDTGKTVSVQAKLLQASKQIFSDIMDQMPMKSTSNDYSDNVCRKLDESTSRTTCGFKTCSGRAIKINDKLLRMSENLFLDISADAEYNCNGDRAGATKKLNEQPALSFKSSSGRTIKVNNELLGKSKNLFSDISTEFECSFSAAGASNGKYKELNKTAVSGFKTSSGRTIEVDNQLLQKSKNLFSDISAETGCNFGEIASSNGAYKRPFKAETLGFKTSSGQTIKVHNESLRTSKNLFSDISAESGCNFGEITPRNGAYKRPIKTKTLGFKTGSGQTIKVNNESLRTSKNLFSDISSETGSNFHEVATSNSAYKRPIKTETLGFRTSSGRTINVNNESLRTSKNLFSDISAETGNNFREVTSSNSAYKRPMKTETLGFKTSSGRTINVNNESLRTSENLFSDITAEMGGNFDEDGSYKKFDSSAISGFKTSSGRAIKVDDKLLQLSKNLFSDVLNEPETIKGIAATAYADVADNFKTDSGNIVNVSAHSAETLTNLCSYVRSSSEYKINDTSKTSPLKNENGGGMKLESEQKSSSPLIQNKSFDLSREIMESASAFLYDISHEQSGSSFFVPNDTSVIGKTNSFVEDHRSSDASDVTASSRSSSPVFDAKYAPTKRKCSSRRSSGAQSLNITYGGRKTNDSSGSSDQISAELETLKMNFSLKSCKRKSNSLDNLHVTAKKCKNISRVSAQSSLQDENEKPASSHRRAAAIAHQQSYISNKPKEFCRPTRGYYSTLIHGDKKDELGIAAGRISLGHLARLEKPKLYSDTEYLKFGLLPDVIRMNSQNARNFTFTSQFISDRLSKIDSIGAILFGDAVPIILNEKNEVTLEEIVRGFLASPGVDPKLISREWIANHYRWIVWKLASMERFFPKSLGGRYFTLDNVLFQLKFKYELEIDRCVRSALKRIMEGDDSPARPLVLCIASIEKEAHSPNDYKMELTDGWYNIFNQADDQINDLISRKKLSIGGKIIITGAELVGFREPCDPLQMGESVRLKFSANSSRRVRWDTRLGFYQGNLRPVNRIQTVLPKGGFISHLTAVVARVYPLLFLEKYDNTAADATADGTGTAAVTWSRLHNEKVEMKKIMAFEKDRQSCIESILSQVTNEVLSENDKTNTDTLADNDRLRDIIQQRVQSRLPVKFSKNRHVSCLLKLRLVDAQNVKNKPSAILTIWNPCDDVSNFFKEDKCYNFLNINVNQIRNGELQLYSTRSSKYDRDSTFHGSTIDVDDDPWFKRRICGVDDLYERNENEHKVCSFDEVDVTGVIIKIQSKTRSNDYEQNSRIYVADLQRRFFALSFRIDSKSFDYGDSLERGKIIAGLNLQWKKGWLCWNTPILYVSEFSSFVQSTNIASLQQGIDQIRRYFQTNNLETFIAECEEKLNNLADSTADVSANENNRSGIANVSVDTTPTVAVSPAPAMDFCNKTNSNNQKTFKNTNTRRRFEKLQNYGRPPTLSPLVLTSQSKLKAKLPLPVSRKSFKS